MNPPTSTPTDAYQVTFHTDEHRVSVRVCFPARDEHSDLGECRVIDPPQWRRAVGKAGDRASVLLCEISRYRLNRDTRGRLDGRTVRQLDSMAMKLERGTGRLWMAAEFLSGWGSGDPVHPHAAAAVIRAIEEMEEITCGILGLRDTLLAAVAGTPGHENSTRNLDRLRAGQ